MIYLTVKKTLKTTKYAQKSFQNSRMWLIRFTAVALAKRGRLLTESLPWTDSEAVGKPGTKPVSGIQTPQFTRMQNPFAGHDKSSGAKTDLVFLGHDPDGVESLLHDAHQAGVDFVFVPKEA